MAVIHDEDSLTLEQNGMITACKGNGSDEYIFAYGNDYRAAVQALYLITGAPGQIPRFALGNWWSRYKAYTDKEYLKVLQGFADRDVPLTVATIDMDWHYSVDVDKRFGVTEKGRNTVYYGGADCYDNMIGWTGYSWNKDLFPDYKAFLQEISRRNLKITLNLHPADGVRWWEDQYDEMAKAMRIDPETAQRIPFDMTNEEFIEAYFSVLHKPYEDAGVAFWWIDWQQGTDSQMDGLDPLWSLNHFHYLDNGKKNEQPLLLSRYCGVGAHRYPLGFSGDTFMTWETLRYLPYFTATASNVGYTWWSHDIGGHMLGQQENEMYLRHIQYGVFSPINRLHCGEMPTLTKEPWYYGNGAGLIAMDFLRLRHKLIPFLYTWSHLTHAQGKAMVEPLYYQWTEPEAYHNPTEYLFGGLLVAPVLNRKLGDGYARVKAWIPEGKWTDIFTGDCYHSPKGGKKVTMLRTLESIPVLAPAGTIIPLSQDNGNSISNPKLLELWVYSGDGSFSLYEDGTVTDQEGEFTTQFEANLSSCGENAVQRLIISSFGNHEIIPENRRIRVLFKDIPEGRIALSQNGVNVEILPLLSECAGVEFEVLPDTQYCVEVHFKENTEMQQRIESARRILLRAEDVHEEKLRTFRRINLATTEEEYRKVVQMSKLRTVIQLRLLEAIE